MYDQTRFQQDFPYVIVSLKELHGLAVKAELDDYYEQAINHGRLYPKLDDLVDKGLLEKGELDKRINVYTVTLRGIHGIDTQRG